METLPAGEADGIGQPTEIGVVSAGAVGNIHAVATPLATRRRWIAVMLATNDTIDATRNADQTASVSGLMTGNWSTN